MGAEAVEARVRATGLLAAGHPVVVLLSGGRDSVCLLDLAVRVAGRGAVSALHVEYGLREDANADAAHCGAVCESLGVPLGVHRPRRAPGATGNVQAWARAERYAEAERLARARGADVAAGHTASDQAETVLYRLAAAPGRRALLGMAARDGRVVRPLLGITREETAAYCAERGLAWREDATNDSDAYARGRVRHGLLEALRAVHPGAEANILRTLEVLRDEAVVLDVVVTDALAGAEAGGARAGGARAGGARAGGAPIARLAALPAPLARLAVQRLADDAAGGRAPAVGARTAEILALGDTGGTGALDLPGGLRAVVEYGRLRFTTDAPPPPGAPAVLPVPGRAPFAGGVLTSRRGAGLPIAREAHAATLDAAALTLPLEVRAWRAGDRMRPLGLGGSRALQDLFTDRKVPRERRAAVPVVLSAGEVAWVPGVAVGEPFRVAAGSADRVRLDWLPRDLA
jgi:tRNA(Ile)-lysidine synthase